jgi:hypothetical protein
MCRIGLTQEAYEPGQAEQWHWGEPDEDEEEPDTLPDSLPDGEPVSPLKRDEQRARGGRTHASLSGER